MEKLKYIIGIDIGSKGCLSVLEYNTDKPTLVDTIPYNLNKWSSYIKCYRNYIFVVEKVASKLGNSMQSVFSLGERSGEVKALLNLYVKPSHIIWKLPKQWQTDLKIVHNDTSLNIKARVAKLVCETFPNDKDKYFMKRKYTPDTNITDSIGIALSF